MSKCCLCFCLSCCGQVLERNVEHFFLLVIYSIVLLYYFFQSLQFIRLHSGQEKLGHSAKFGRKKMIPDLEQHEGKYIHCAVNYSLILHT